MAERPTPKNHDANAAISASEVNRFCYCAWQWYYEKQYGRKQLQALAARRNAEAGIDAPDPALSLFNKGNAFHANYMRQYRHRQVVRRFARALLVAAIGAGVLAAFGWLLTK